MKVGKRVLSILMSVVLVVGLNPGVALAEPGEAFTASALQSENVAADGEAEVHAEADEGQSDASPIQALSSQVTTLEAEEPTVVATGECGAQGGNVIWTLDSEGALTVSGRGAMRHGRVAEEHTRDIKSIKVLDGVTTIGWSAFRGTPARTATLAKGIEELGNYAFESCVNLGELKLPSSLSKIGEGCFRNDRTLRGIVIPGSVKEIPYDAFSGCSGLSSAVLEEGIEKIGLYAFKSCESLTLVSLPASTLAVDSRSFAFCSGLVALAVDERNDAFCVRSGALYTKDGTKLVLLAPGKSGAFAIADGTVELEEFCFYGCEAVTSVHIPASLKEGSKSLPSAYWYSVSTKPCSVASYEVDEDNATYKSEDGVLFSKDGAKILGFPAGKHARTYAIPEGVKGIGDGAFDGSQLTDIFIPLSMDTISNLNSSMFPDGYGSCGLAPNCRVRYAGTREQFEEIDLDGRADRLTGCSFVYQVEAFGEAGNGVLYTLSTDGVLELSSWSGAVEAAAMEDYDDAASPWSGLSGKVVSVEANSQIASVGACAFAGFDRLESVTLSGAVASVGANAFEGCAQLRSVACLGNPFSVHSVANERPSFPQAVELSYYPAFGTWQDDAGFDTGSGTWNGYRVVEAIPLEVGSIALEKASVIVSGDGNAESVKVTVLSREGADITGSVSVSVLHSEGFDSRKHPNPAKSVIYDANAGLLRILPKCYEDDYTIRASAIGSDDAVYDTLVVSRAPEVLSGVSGTSTAKTIGDEDGSGLIAIGRMLNQYGEEFTGEGRVGVYSMSIGKDISDEMERFGIYAIGRQFYASQRTPQGSYSVYCCSGEETPSYAKQGTTFWVGNGAGFCTFVENSVTWHTATFMAGGKVVDTVEFAEGNASLDEPAVPERENYHGEWAAYDLASAKGDITVEAVYTRIDTDAVSEIDVKADESDNGDGTKTIVLSASAATQTVRTEKTNAKPLDVVLVLDQSGSMADTLSATDARSKRDALVECANDFLGKLFDNAQNTGADHRVALAGFAYSAYNGGAYRNTGLLATAGGGPKGYASLSASDYANALLPISSGGALNPAVTAGIERVAAEGATAADLGLKMARNIFSSQGDAGERERVVVFITDGMPTCWGETPQLIERTAAAAISEARYLKGAQGAKVYAVGVHENADPAADFNGASNGIVADARGSFKSYDLNRFMHAVSSNYPSATSMASFGAGDKAAGYYLGVTDTGNLSNIFRDILYTTVFETKVFDRATLTCKLARGVELEWGQERDICENLGLAAGDVTVTRNDDGTCDIVMRNVPVVLADDGTGALVYQAQLAFQVTFEGEAAVAQVRATVSDRSEVGGEASYSSAHEHSFAEVSRTGTCETGVTAHYACSCGAERDEIVVAAGTQHDYVAEITDDGGLAQSVERLVCSGCGHVIDKNINYQVAYSKGFRTAVLDLSLLENEVVVQPDGTIGMRFYVGESGARSYAVTRISEDGNRTVYQTRLADGWLVFDADHFSVYAVAEADEDGNPVAGDISYETAQLALAGEDVDADIASGTWGTCPWEISADGTLTVHPGVGVPVRDDNYIEGSNSYSFATRGPWTAYAADVKRIVFAAEDGGKVVAPKDAQALCFGLSKAESVDLSGLDTSGVYSIVGMFRDCEALESVDLSVIDTSNIRNISDLFCSCSSLQSANLAGFDASKVGSSYRMFLGCSSLTYLDLTSFDTSCMSEVSGMFNYCSSLKTILVSDKWSMTNARSSNLMFNECASLVGGNGTTFDASHIGAEYARVDAAGSPGYLTGDASTVKAGISNATVTLSKTSFAYNGKKQVPSVKSAKLGAINLGKGDYTVSFLNSSKKAIDASKISAAGTYYVQLAGQGKYTGTAVAQFKIAKASLAKATVSSPTYTGKAVAPVVKVGSTAFKVGTDYTIAYKDAKGRLVAAKNLKAAGSYKATVKGVGSCTGSVTRTFAVAKAANPMNVVAKAASVSYSKKKARTVAASKAYNFKKKAVGAVTYARVASGSSKWLSAVNKKTGAITVKAGAPRAKTQSVKVKVTAVGNANYKSATKVVTVKVKVK